ncbi:unnamed protein product, partial [methanotrophic bacterial endosymbiont of Bathymodiolus sp.]
IVDTQMDRMRADPALTRLILNPKVGARKKKQTKL